MISEDLPIFMLLIEDSASQRHAIKLALKHVGAAVGLTEAASLADGIYALRERSFDVILLDLSLPDSDSVDAITRIRSYANDAPIIVISANEDKNLAVQAVKLGAQDFLVKASVSGDLLLRSIRYAIERSKSEKLRSQLNDFVNNESQFRQAFETAPIGIFLANKHGKFLRANEVFCRMTGYTEQELMQRTFVDLTHSEDIPDTVRYMRMLDEDGAVVYKIEKRYIKKSGAELWARVSATLLPSAEQAELCRLVMVENFYEERRAKMMLQTQLEVAKMVSSSSTLMELSKPVLTAIGNGFDAQYAEIWKVNAQSGQLLHIGAWCTTESRLEQLISGATRIFVEPGVGLVGRVWNNQRAEISLDLKLDVLSGQAGHLLKMGLVAGIAVPLITNDTVFGVLAIFGDDTFSHDEESVKMLAATATLIAQFIHRHDADEKARRAMLTDQREEFIATLVHDLKTPITGANRLFDLLIEGALGSLDLQQSQIIGKLKQSNLTQLKMITNLLQMYRLESGTQVLEIGELDIEGMVETCVSAIQPLADEHNVTIKTLLGFEGQAWADQMALSRVLQNLLDNALKYTPEGGTVEVSTLRVHDRLVFSVKDSGPGITSTTASRLFQRFWQGETRRTTISGSGIGLYLCKQIVEAHGGNISYETMPDHGTTFIVSIPTSQPATAMLARP